MRCPKCKTTIDIDTVMIAAHEATGGIEVGLDYPGCNTLWFAILTPLSMVEKP